MLNGNKRKLSNEQLLEIRSKYFYDLLSFNKLSKLYNVSPGLIQKIVEGRNGYSTLKDGIPEDIKQKRKPSYIRHSLHIRERQRGQW